MPALPASVRLRTKVQFFFVPIRQGLVCDQVHALGRDRSRLAAELDTAAARTRLLETTNREIARRLDVAIDSVRGVLESNDR